MIFKIIYELIEFINIHKVQFINIHNVYLSIFNDI